MEFNNYYGCKHNNHRSDRNSAYDIYHYYLTFDLDILVFVRRVHNNIRYELFQSLPLRPGLGQAPRMRFLMGMFCHHALQLHISRSES